MPASASRRTAARPAAAQDTSSSSAVEERVYAAISNALLSGRLRPGTPLRERALAEALDCTRGALRKVLARLGAEKRLVLEHNRGAFVPSPTAQDMRDVYRARRIIEAGLVATLFGQITAEQEAALRRHVRAEHKAFEEGRREDAIRLAGEFHLLLVRMAGSEELLGYTRQLVANTELYKALFDSVDAARCAPTEHEQIIDALAGGTLRRALDKSLAHLDHLEQRVIAGAAEEQPVELADIFSAKPPRGKTVR